MSDRILYMYMPDPKEPRRVMTVARLLYMNHGTRYLQVATAINKVSAYGVVDQFRKSLGREIATGRLASPNSYCIEVGDMKPVEALACFFLDNEDFLDNSIEARIAASYFRQKGWELETTFASGVLDLVNDHA